jgi:hypothetical protein
VGISVFSGQGLRELAGEISALVNSTDGAIAGGGSAHSADGDTTAVGTVDSIIVADTANGNAGEDM